MRTSNPVFRDAMTMYRAKTDVVHMSIQGTILKAVLLVSLLTFSSLFVWLNFDAHKMGQIRFLLRCSVPLTFLVGWVTYFKPHWSYLTAPVYALSQGILVGAISSMAETFFPGVVGQAIPLTFFVLFGMLLLYTTGMIQVTHRLRTVIFVSMIAVFMTYLIEWIGIRFFQKEILYIHQGGMMGIVFSTFVVLLAAFTLLLDFEFIVRCQRSGAPKYMEWYCAYGLMVTLVWLYIRILEFLVRTSRRNR